MNLSGKTVLVTGVTGTAGGRIAARIVKEGALVKGLIRNADDIHKLEHIGVEPVMGDLTDQASLRHVLEGIHFVIHAAAYLGDDMDLAIAANIHGVENLTEEALTAGVERFVHISTLSVYGEPEDGMFDEASATEERHPAPYVFTKAESERIVHRAQLKGLSCVILRPGAICAERNSYWGDRQVERMAQSDAVTWVHPEDMVPWVHTENLAEMCVLALTHPNAVNETYHAIDGNYPEADFRVRIAQAMGKPLLPPQRTPQRAVYSHDKIRTKLGYRPVRNFEATVSALADLAKGQG